MACIKIDLQDVDLVRNDFQEGRRVLQDIFGHRPIKKVLLVNPPDIETKLFDYDLTKRGRSNNYPPYGLAVLGRHLLSSGFEAKICNLNHEILKKCQESENASEFDFDSTWKAKLSEEVNAFQPDLIGITCLFSVTHPSLVNVCREVKELSANWVESGSNIPLAIGGVHVTHDVQTMLVDIPEADFSFLHESEVSFVNFLKIVNNQKPPEELSQVIFNMPERKLIFDNETKPQPESLNIIPAFELMDLQEHSKVGTQGSWYGFVDKPIATVLSNRGCRAACTFCNVRNFNGVGVRHRSVDSVLDEISVLKNEYGIGHFIWLDDDLLHDEKRAVELFNGMVQRDLDMTWDATNGVIAHSCKDEVIAAAADSGCIGMYFGVESGNEQNFKEY